MHLRTRCDVVRMARITLHVPCATCTPLPRAQRSRTITAACCPAQRIRFTTSAIFDVTVGCEFITPFFPQVRCCLWWCALTVC